MTITYQPSAAGISWLVLSETLDSRTQMEKELLKMSAENSSVQVSMTLSTSEQTEQELLYQAKGQQQNAICMMAGAGMGMIASTTMSAIAVGTAPKTVEPTTNSTMNIEKVTAAPDLSSPEEIEMMDMGTAKVNGENTPITPSIPVQNQAALTTAAKNEPVSNYPKLYHFCSGNNGNLFASSLSTAAQGLGSSLQATQLTNAAEAKKLEALAQGLGTVMNAQGQMLASTISSCDSFFNNLEGSITTIIQVSAVRG